MGRFTHKQILQELKMMLYPIIGIKTDVLRKYARQFQADPDINIIRIGDMLVRVCNLLDKAGDNIL